MSTKSIHPYAVALYYTQAELQELGLEMPVTAQTARRLVSNALCGSGREPWSGMEVDLFSYEDAVLLLARPSQESAHCFLFRDFEELLAAVRCLPETAPSTLFHAGHRRPVRIRATRLLHTGAERSPGRAWESPDRQPGCFHSAQIF